MRIFSRWCAHLAMQPPFSATHPHPAPRENRSPIARAPARRGLLAALQWAALWLRVEVNHHPRSTRAALASHPRTTLHVVHTPLKASQAGALLVGTRSRSVHDHAKSSSTSWSRRSSKLWMSPLAFHSSVPTPDSLYDPQSRTVSSSKILHDQLTKPTEAPVVTFCRFCQYITLRSSRFHPEGNNRF